MMRSWKPKLAAVMRSQAVATIAVVAAAIHLYRVVCKNRPPVPRLDFSSFYLWAWALRHDLNPYNLDLKPYADRFHIYIGAIYRADYPPTFILMFEPFTSLNPWPALWVWSGISVLLLLASLVLLVPARKAISIPAALILISLAIFYRPVQLHFIFLQTQILVLFLLVVMWLRLRRGDDLGAGASLAVAGLLKVFPLFMMLYLLCMRRWRALGFTLIFLAAGFILTLAIVGPRSFDFFRTVFHHMDPVAGIPEAPIVGLAGTIVRLYRRFVPADSNHALVLIRNLAEVLLEAAVLGITALAIVRSRTDSLKSDYAFGLCMAAMVLCYSNSWSHYMVLLLFPLCQIAVAAEIGTAPAIAPVLALISYIVAEVSYSAAHRSFINGHLSLGLWLIEGMFVATAMTYAAAYALTVSKVPTAVRSAPV